MKRALAWAELGVQRFFVAGRPAGNTLWPVRYTYMDAYIYIYIYINIYQVTRLAAVETDKELDVGFVAAAAVSALRLLLPF